MGGAKIVRKKGKAIVHPGIHFWEGISEEETTELESRIAFYNEAVARLKISPPDYWASLFGKAGIQAWNDLETVMTTLGEILLLMLRYARKDTLAGLVGEMSPFDYVESKRVLRGITGRPEFQAKLQEFALEFFGELVLDR